MTITIEVSAVCGDGAGDITTCNDALDSAEFIAVYIRNPLAFHIEDFAVEGDGTRAQMMRETSRRAFIYAEALASHLGGEVESRLCRPRDYAIAPQKDYFADPETRNTIAAKAAPGFIAETDVRECEESEATSWGVFDVTPDLPGPELVEDYPSRTDAERAVAALVAGEPLPEPNWCKSVLSEALRFVEGFEGDELQEGIDGPAGLLARMRGALGTGPVASDVAMPRYLPWKDMPPSIADLLQSHGFHFDLGGGGALMPSLHGTDGWYIWATAHDGGFYPDGHDFNVSIYSPASNERGEAVASFIRDPEGNGDHPLLSLKQALAGAIAIMNEGL